MHAQLIIYIYDNLCGEARNEVIHIEYHFPNHKCSVYNTSTLIIGVNTQVYLYNLPEDTYQREPGTKATGRI